MTYFSILANSRRGAASLACGVAVVASLVSSQFVGVDAATRGDRPRCRGAVATIVGDDGSNHLVGTPGRDVIVGGAGYDRIEGRGGNDLICGGSGADDLRGGPGDDRLFGGTQGVDTPEEPGQGDLLSGGPGDDLLVPQPGGTLDVITYRSARHGVHVSGDVVRGQGVDRLVLSAPVAFELTRHDDTFIGTAAADFVRTGGGKDVVRTRDGSDYVDLGRDTRAATGRDTVWLGRGDDTLWAGTNRAAVDAGPGDDSINGGPLGPVVDAGPGADEVSLSDYPTGVVTGGPGVDKLTYLGTIRSWQMGGDGSALLGPSGGVHVNFLAFEKGWIAASISTPSVRVVGTDGRNVLTSTSPVPTTFVGRGGNDSFSGSEAVDTFNGGAGQDRYAADRDPTTGNQCISVEVDAAGACSP